MMRTMVFILMLGMAPLALRGEDKKPPTTLRGVLLEQLRTTHSQEDWFVPAAIAVQGLTAEQPSGRREKTATRWGSSPITSGSGTARR
jgi:hypothetical protein